MVFYHVTAAEVICEVWKQCSLNQVPWGHCVDDLIRMFDVLIGDVHTVNDLGQSPVGRRDLPANLGCADANIKNWGLFKMMVSLSASPAIRRSVQEAGAVLEKLGVEVVPFEVPDPD